MSKQKHTPNDQRAIVKNPTSVEFHKDALNQGKVEELNSVSPPPEPKK